MKYVLIIPFFISVAFAASSTQFENFQVSNSLANAINPDIVWTGSNYGLVWSDSRGEGEPEIYFARLNEFGEKLEREIKISNSSDKISDDPAIIWADNNYGVVWSEYDRDASKNEEGCNLYFARLDKNGDEIGGIISVTSDDFSSCPSKPAISWDGIGYGITWHEKRRETETSQIFFTRLNALGSKLVEDIIVSETYHSWNSSITGAREEYGIVWQSASNIYFTRLDLEGVKQGNQIRISQTTDTSYFPDIVWNGSSYGVAWQGYDTDGEREIFFAKLDQEGNKQTEDIPVTSNRGRNYSIYPSIIWGNSEYGIVWQQGEGVINFAALDETGNRKSKIIQISNAQVGRAIKPAIALGTSQYALAWYDTRGEVEGEEIYFARLPFSDVSEESQLSLLAFINYFNGNSWYLIILILIIIAFSFGVIYLVKRK